LLAAALGMYGWRVDARRLRVRRLVLPVPDLPSAFEAFRIAQISDLHLGGPVVDDLLPDVIESVQREQADLIAITGDFITGAAPLSALAGAREALARLDAASGVWAVLGNHDHYVGADAVAEILDGTGIGVLRNAHHVLTRSADRLVIAGLDDALYGRPDLDVTLDGAPGDAHVILLAHEPDMARLMAAEERIVLQLSGHTHGGQIRVPGLPAMILPKLGRLYTAGAYRVHEMALYVNSGIGVVVLPLRFYCPPEITIITLVRGARWNGSGGAAWRDVPHVARWQRERPHLQE
jgi:predicted MPP superfamily phosphohydrolase